MKTRMRFAGLFCLALGLCCPGCGESSRAQDTGRPERFESESVERLHEKLQNLQGYVIEDCEFSIWSTSPAFTLVPSPSDTKYWFLGSATLDESSAAAIQADYAWSSIARESLPVDLVERLPEGEVRVSEEFNDSFEDNRFYAHGYGVLVGEEGTRLYYMAHDLDHGIVLPEEADGSE